MRSQSEFFDPHLDHEICRCKDQKKLVKALRDYDRLLMSVPYQDTENTEENIHKLYKRGSRMNEINDLYVMIIF